ncbi:MAG: hypothetical protein E6Z60_16650 [Mixta calida]|uniref:hypothetical protein n=1 Tax=Mixta calida TaxID=665913 RepID=UPI00289D27A7|nr:hypothetical protein [Mixta calida]MDU5828531.1 hypothetical protein [Mixta calida]
MSGFTKGPWAASNYYSDATTILDSEGFSVADAPRCLILEGYSDKGFQHWADSEEAHRWISEEEQRANGHLIAAAPELLEALQETVKDLVAYQVNALHAAKSNNRWEGCAEAVQPSIDAAHAAIAKALGNH